MKILFANGKCGYFGGVEQVIFDTARGLRERGHSCYLVYATEERDVGKFTAPFEQCFRCAELEGSPAKVDTRDFESILKAVRPDVVFFHKIARLPRSGILRGVRTLRMVHDHDLYCPTGYKYFRKSGRVCHHKAGWRCWADLGFVAKNPDSLLGVSCKSIGQKIEEMHRNQALDTILAVSSFIREGLVMNGFPEEKVHILHPILQIDTPPPTSVPREPRILFVGQLIRGKGVDLLLRALKELRCDFTAEVIGSGNMVERVHTLCKELNLNARVNFRDWVAHDEIGRFYTKAKVVAAPSRWPEPFTLVGQEAMRYGRPVVAFDVGGNSNWLEHNLTGILVSEQDVAGYAWALERLLTDTPFARRLGQNAYKRVQERFSFEGFLDQLESHFCGIPRSGFTQLESIA